MIAVGVDFDNTLIDYDRLFAIAAHDFGWINTIELTKIEVKSHLLAEDGEDLRWRQLQTVVYSRYIHRARPYAGVKAFFEKVIGNGDSIVIISHKTRFSNFDGQTDLIEPAKLWLRQQGIIGEQGMLCCENVFFLATREEKIRTIRQEAVDVYIDDLSTVLTDNNFPEKTLAIWFSEIEDNKLVNSCSWDEISLFYDSCKIMGLSAATTLSAKYKGLPCDISKIYSGGNNNLFKVSWKYQSVVVKVGRNTSSMDNEYEALKFLEATVANIPKAVLFDRKAGVLVETALSGKVIKYPDENLIEEAVDFLVNLDRFGNSEVEYRMASHYRDTLAGYIVAVDRRLQDVKQHLHDLPDSDREAAAALIHYKLEGVWAKVKDRFIVKTFDIGLNLYDKFPSLEMILSPSDYGFHNMLATDGGGIEVCDFEYFGWDDKAKLIADFFHHQGMELTDEQRLFFIKNSYRKGLITPSVMQRLELIIDVIGVEWILIILNVIDKDKLKQKACAGSNALISSNEILHRQLSKADMILDDYMLRLESGCLFITTEIMSEQWVACYV